MLVPFVFIGLLIGGRNVLRVVSYTNCYSNCRIFVRTARTVSPIEANLRTLHLSDLSALGASKSSSNGDTVGVPRLHHDLRSLIRWIEKSGGLFDADVQKGNEGWNLISSRAIESGICIFSNPAYMEVPLLENAQLLMSSLDQNQWRARLAVALLSERVRPSSHYRAYLRNLPFEFWGMPVFYSTQEFSIMQDLSLMQRTRDRCKFLSEFADSVLTPLQKTNRDPFSGHNADVNAFGWGFASAASRALRNPSVISEIGNPCFLSLMCLNNMHIRVRYIRMCDIKRY
jgi:hypothetical protein